MDLSLHSEDIPTRTLSDTQPQAAAGPPSRRPCCCTAGVVRFDVPQRIRRWHGPRDYLPTVSRDVSSCRGIDGWPRAGCLYGRSAERHLPWHCVWCVVEGATVP